MKKLTIFVLLIGLSQIVFAQGITTQSKMNAIIQTEKLSRMHASGRLAEMHGSGLLGSLALLGKAPHLLAHYNSGALAGILNSSSIDQLHFQDFNYNDLSASNLSSFYLDTGFTILHQLHVNEELNEVYEVSGVPDYIYGFLEKSYNLYFYFQLDRSPLLNTPYLSENDYPIHYANIPLYTAIFEDTALLNFYSMFNEALIASIETRDRTPLIIQKYYSLFQVHKSGKFDPLYRLINSEEYLFLIGQLANATEQQVPYIVERDDITSRILSCLDQDLNWDYSASFDEQGVIYSEKINYSDLMGLPIQAQWMNKVSNKAMAQESVTNEYLEEVVVAPSAPTGRNYLCFKDHFIRSSTGNDYSYLDFNLPVTTGNSPGQKDNPRMLDQTSPGELGWYYSNTNTSANNSLIGETFNPSSAFPLGVSDFYTDGTKRLRRTTAPGDSYKPGAGKDIRYFYVSGDMELDFVFGPEQVPYLSLNSIGQLVGSPFVKRHYRKEIVFDSDQKVSTITYYGARGEVVAKCMSGLSSPAVCSRTSFRVNAQIDLGVSNSIDLHLPSQLKNSMRLHFPKLRGALTNFYTNGNTEDGVGTYTIIDAYTGKKLVKDVDYTRGQVMQGGRVDYYTITFINPVSEYLRISFNYTTGFLTAYSGESLFNYDQVIPLSYELDYTHWSLYFYNEANQLVKTIQPKGIDCTFSPNYALSQLMIPSSNLQSGLYDLRTSLVNLSGNPGTHSAFAGKFRVTLQGPVYNPPPPPPCGTCPVDINPLQNPPGDFGRPTGGNSVALCENINSIYAFDRRLDTVISGVRGKLYHRDTLLEGMASTGIFSQDTNYFLVKIDDALIRKIQQKISYAVNTDMNFEFDSSSNSANRYRFNIHEGDFTIIRQPVNDSLPLSPGMLMHLNVGRNIGTGPTDIGQFEYHPASITRKLKFRFSNGSQFHDVFVDLKINLKVIYAISGSTRTYLMTYWEYISEDGYPMLDFSSAAVTINSNELTFIPVNLQVFLIGSPIFQSSSNLVINTTIPQGSSQLLSAYLINKLQPLKFNGQGSWVPYSAPNHQMATEQRYDQMGNLVYGQNNDVGAREAVYNSIGMLRFSQDPELRSANKFAYVHYDASNRPIESGMYFGSNANVLFDSYKNRNALFNPSNLTPWVNKNNELDQLNFFNSSLTEEEVHILYDVSATDLPTNTGGAYVQRFLHGKVSKTWNDHSTTWYSYDYQGRVEWVLQQITGLGVTTIDYTYDMLGNVLTVDYMKHRPSERLVHHYTYDANKALLLAETSRNGISKRPEAKYIYYLHGPLKRVELAHNLQGIDYTYTIDGKLKAINHADLNPATDPGKDGLLGVSGFMQDQFGLILDYHHQDYAKQGTDFQTGQNMGTAERYDGLIKSSRWKIRNGSQSATLQQAYKYTYDKLGQLSLAEFGTYSPATQSLTVGNTNKENPSSYDIHGNILALQRTNASGALMDNFTYQYPAFSNRLTAVTNTGGNSGYSAAMTYFANGNIKTLQEGSSPVRHLAYNAMGLTAKVAKGSTGNEPIVTFVYNERGQRIKKETYNPAGTAIAFTTYYVYDLGGNLLSTYEKYHNNTEPPLQKELYLYGAEMLGVMHGQGAAAGGGELPCEECPIPPAPERIGIGGTTNTVYYLKDHLGNVRATLLREQPVHAGLLNWASYYPFGMRLTDGTMSSGQAALVSSYPQRHWYQGDYSELDPETGLQAFDLRMYSSRIGRWLSVDPYAQYWSPYLAMGNNPVSRVDPDGGWDDWYVDEAGNEVYFADKHGHIGGGYTWLGETKVNYGNGRYAYMTVLSDNVSLGSLEGKAGTKSFTLQSNGFLNEALTALKYPGIDKRIYGDEAGRVDCSKFCQEIAQKSGYGIPRTAKAQMDWYKKNGVWSDKLSNARLGDHAFWDRGNGEYHTGVITGVGTPLNVTHATVRKYIKPAIVSNSLLPNGIIQYWDFPFVGVGRPK